MWRASPDGDGVPGSGPDVPAAVEPGRVLEGPARAGDDAAGRPQELGYVAAGCMEGRQLLLQFHCRNR